MDEMRHHSAQNCGERRGGPREWAGQPATPSPPSIFKGAPAPLFLPYRSRIASVWRCNFYVAACTRSYLEYLAPIKHIDLVHRPQQERYVVNER